MPVSAAVVSALSSTACQNKHPRFYAMTHKLKQKGLAQKLVLRGLR